MADKIAGWGCRDCAAAVTLHLPAHFVLFLAAGSRVANNGKADSAGDQWQIPRRCRSDRKRAALADGFLHGFLTVAIGNVIQQKVKFPTNTVRFRVWIRRGGGRLLIVEDETDDGFVFVAEGTAIFVPFNSLRLEQRDASR